MKIGDLVTIQRGRGSSPTSGAVGVIVDYSPTHPSWSVTTARTILVDWTNGDRGWVKPSWVKPYEGDAGKNDKDIK